MGLSLLAPLFLAGLIAVAVPILVHLTARDRRDVRRFPSLRFLTRLPYRQARRQRFRHPLLFALRVLALVLLALAFSRPLIEGSGLATGVPGREVVIALDRSYSMGYGDAWERAIAAAREAVEALPEGSRASLVTFDEEAQIAATQAAGGGEVIEVLDGLAPGASRTRFGPALRLAAEILLDSTLAEREVILISDLQAAGWERSADPWTLPPGVTLRVVDLAADDPANALIAGVEVHQGQSDAGAEMAVTTRVANRGPDPIAGLSVELSVDASGAAPTKQIDLEPASGSAVRLGPIALPSVAARVTVSLGDDPLPPDNTFHAVVRPRAPIPVLLIEAPGARPEGSLFLREALTASAGAGASGSAVRRQAEPSEPPAFELRVRRSDAARAEDVEWARVVIVHDGPLPAGAAGRALARRVAEGGGLWVILGSRSRAGEGTAALLPGSWQETVDRLGDRGVGLAGVDYDHPIFEVFAGPSSGNLAAARLYRYRPIAITDDATAVARTADGAVVLAEGRAGEGRVLLWGSAFDNRWSDLPVQAVFLPLVHQACRYLAGERAAPSWHQVGETLDLKALVEPDSRQEPGAAAGVVTPSSARREISLAAGPALLTLEEAGFYEILLPGGTEPVPLAANVDRAESDLTKLDAEALVAASTAPPAAGAASSTSLTREQRERRQALWRVLLLAALLLLAAESWWSNRGVGSRGLSVSSRPTR